VCRQHANTNVSITNEEEEEVLAVQEIEGRLKLENGDALRHEVKIMMEKLFIGRSSITQPAFILRSSQL
jgi:hypothetical protein